jgi:hypothetical protein
MKWLTVHCKDVHFNTAARYMRLANSSHVVKMKSATSLRQAYILTGIIQEIEPEQLPPPVVDVPTKAGEATIDNATRSKGVQLVKRGKLESLAMAKVDRIELVKTIVTELVEHLKQVPRRRAKEVKPLMKPLKRWL